MSNQFEEEDCCKKIKKNVRLLHFLTEHSSFATYCKENELHPLSDTPTTTIMCSGISQGFSLKELTSTFSNAEKILFYQPSYFNAKTTILGVCFVQFKSIKECTDVHNDEKYKQLLKIKQIEYFIDDIFINPPSGYLYFNASSPAIKTEQQKSLID